MNIEISLFQLVLDDKGQILNETLEKNFKVQSGNNKILIEFDSKKIIPDNITFISLNKYGFIRHTIFLLHIGVNISCRQRCKKDYWYEPTLVSTSEKITPNFTKAEYTWSPPTFDKSIVVTTAENLSLIHI